MACTDTLTKDQQQLLLKDQAEQEQWKQSEWRQQIEQQERYDEAYYYQYVTLDKHVQTWKRLLKIYVSELFPKVCEDSEPWEFYREVFQQEHTQLLFGELLAQKDETGLIHFLLQHEDIQDVFQEILEEEDHRQVLRRVFHEEDVLKCLCLMTQGDPNMLVVQAQHREDTRLLWLRITQQTNNPQRLQQVFEQELQKKDLHKIIPQHTCYQELFRQVFQEVVSPFIQQRQSQQLQQDLINGSEWPQLLQQQQRYEEAYYRYHQDQAERERWEQSEWRQQIEQQERYDEAYYFQYLPVQAQWEQIVCLTKAFYPMALTAPCLVPALHFNRIPLAATTFQGLTVYVQASDGQWLPPKEGKKKSKNQDTAKVNMPNSKSMNTSTDTTCSDRVATSSQLLATSDFPKADIPQSMWSHDDFNPEKDKLRQVMKDSIQADVAQGRLLHNLKQLGDRQQEGMFVVSEVDYGDYLCDTERFPRAVDSAPHLKNRVLDTSAPHANEGDIDILIISPSRGLLVGEVKSVSGNNDKTLKNKVLDACKQLDKSGDVVCYWLSDIAPHVTVRKSLILPNVSRERLKRVLEGSKALQKCLGTEDDVTQLCLCLDDLSGDNHDDVSGDQMTSLCNWWERRMPRSDVTDLPDDLYWQVAARFVGPASTIGVHCSTGPRVEVKTEGQAVAELGRRVAKLVVTTQQLQILSQNKCMVCITGGPGTGKTLMLVLQGLRWLRQGLDVYIFSSFVDTLAASCLIEHQLNMTLKAKSGPEASPPPGRVHLYQADFAVGGDEEVTRAVNDLTTAAEAEGGTLCVILDEGQFAVKNQSTDRGRRLHSLVEQLSQRVQHLHFWAVSMDHNELPAQMQHESLTVPLRFCPTVLKEVKPAIDRISKEFDSYSPSNLPSAGHGPEVVRLYHHGNGHTGKWPADCEACGHKVADKLLYLGVGHEDSSPLHYRDVLVISSRSVGLHDDNGPALPATAIVRGLRAKGLPVCVLSLAEEFVMRREVYVKNVQDVAKAETDWITVSDFSSVRGLERRVVVFLQDSRDIEDGENYSEVQRDVTDRFFAISRCTTQLVMVTVPPGDSDSNTN